MAILAAEDDEGLRAAPLANWDAAFAHLARMAVSAPLLVILDEYQYAAEADPSLASRLQRWWSRTAANLPIYLILCGSYVRFFVKNVLTGPAYGRNTGSLQLRPLDYRAAALFFPDWSAEDRIRAYAVTGGVPHYLLQFNPQRSLAWNITHQRLAAWRSALPGSGTAGARGTARAARLLLDSARTQRWLDSSKRNYHPRARSRRWQ